MWLYLRAHNIENRKATVKRDLAIKDIHGRILFPAEMERRLQYVAIDAASRFPTINDARAESHGKSARIDGHEKSLNFAFNKLHVKKEKPGMHTMKHDTLSAYG